MLVKANTMSGAIKMVINPGKFFPSSGSYGRETSQGMKVIAHTRTGRPKTYRASAVFMS